MSFNRSLNRIYIAGGLPSVSVDGNTLEQSRPVSDMDVGVNETTGRIYAYLLDEERNGTLVVYREAVDLALSALTVANTGSLPSIRMAVRFEYSNDGGATFNAIPGVARTGSVARGGTGVATKSWMMVAPWSYQSG